MQARQRLLAASLVTAILAFGVIAAPGVAADCPKPAKDCTQMVEDTVDETVQYHLHDSVDFQHAVEFQAGGIVHVHYTE